MYEIVKQTKYMMEVKRVENIEDCIDVVYTDEELSEMGFKSNWYMRGGVRVFNKKVKDSIREWLGKIKEGNKSIICKDEELISFLVDEERSISEFVDNTRRVGNRIFRYEKKEVVKKKPSYDDWLSLCYVYENLVSGLDIRISYNNCDKVGFVKSLKKLMSWKEVVKRNSRLKNDEWVKKLFDNPELY